MKKIYDIIPPEQAVAKTESPSKLKKEKKMKKEKPQQSKGSSKRIFLIIPGVILFALVFTFLILSAKAKLDLAVKVKMRDLSVEQTIKVKDGAETSIENNVIKAVILEEQAQTSQAFQTTGKEAVGEKAKGKITIYNKQEPAEAITLRATTRFLSEQGSKIFRTESKVVVPKAIMVGGKLQPGSIEIEVVAEEPGAGYNITNANFSVPGLSGTVWYYNVWAESKSPMQGGDKTEKAKVSKADIETAQTTLEENLRQIALNTLKAKLAEELVINEQAFLTDDFTINCSVKTGDFVENFECSGVLKVRGLAFSSDDLKTLGLYFLNNEIAGNEQIKEETFSFVETPKTVVLKDKEMEMDVVLKAQTFIPFDETALIADILGRDENDMLDVLANSYGQVEVISLKFWPFWVSKAPKSIEKVNLSLTF